MIEISKLQYLAIAIGQVPDRFIHQLKSIQKNPYEQTCIKIKLEGKDKF